MINGQYRIKPTPDMAKKAPAVADEILGSLKDKGLAVGTVIYALELALQRVNETAFTGVPCDRNLKSLTDWATEILNETDPEPIADA